MTHLDRRILDAWAATENMHRPNPAAAPDSVTAAEQVIGRRLPQAFRELYLVHDGGAWLGGNLNLLSLDDESEESQGSVVRHAATLRGWDWPVPDDVVVIGNDGAGDIFGLWLPNAEERPLVVTIGRIFEPGCMGIAGQDLNAFLRARTAYYLLLPPEDTTSAGLDALDVPVGAPKPRPGRHHVHADVRVGQPDDPALVDGRLRGPAHRRRPASDRLDGLTCSFSGPHR